MEDWIMVKLTNVSFHQECDLIEYDFTIEERETKEIGRCCVAVDANTLSTCLTKDEIKLEDCVLETKLHKELKSSILYIEATNSKGDVIYNG